MGSPAHAKQPRLPTTSRPEVLVMGEYVILIGTEKIWHLVGRKGEENVL